MLYWYLCSLFFSTIYNWCLLVLRYDFLKVIRVVFVWLIFLKQGVYYCIILCGAN